MCLKSLFIIVELKSEQLYGMINQVNAVRKKVFGKQLACFVDLAFVDQNALDQMYDAMKQPFVISGAIMPDVHAGYSLPIGSVIATNHYIVPAWVGYDIGCGVASYELDIKRHHLENHLDSLFDALKAGLPTKERYDSKYSLHNSCFHRPPSPISQRALDTRKGVYQVGTIGSGNHFVEVGFDDDREDVWITVHSGSRGTGHAIASEYMALAAGSDKPVEGHFSFDVCTDIGRQYLIDQEWAIKYAEYNRDALMKDTLTILRKVIGIDAVVLTKINKSHNHVDRVVMVDHNDKPTGQYMWVHRKGATDASKFTRGVIPGSMKDGVFIVEGLGNRDSLNSCSHGAGRILSRSQAKKLDLELFKESMGDIRAIITPGTLDESPGAYKDIFDVMRQQRDLVSVIHHIKPLVNIKGESKRVNYRAAKDSAA